MPIQILMPALSPTMEHGKLAKWLVKEGDKVSAGNILAEIETDKATMEVEAVDDGTVGRILVPEGTDGVAVNAPIAVLLAEGEDSSALDAPIPSVAKAAPPTSGETTSTVVAAAVQVSQTNGHSGARIFSSPLARRVAREKNLDLATIAGSGPHGRVILRDVEGAVSSGAAKQTTLASVQVLAPAVAAMSDEQIFAIYEKGSYDIVPHDNMRKTIAQRLVQAKQTIPHFYLTVDCELDTLLDARQRLNMRSPKDEVHGYRLSVNDFIIKAMGLALKRVPKANATWTEQGTLYHHNADIAVAVAVEGGLFTPVIRNVNEKNLVEIANQMRDFVDRARKRRLVPHEYLGGTTSISNLGMYAVRQFDAVINPPHATILAVGQGEKRPVVKGDQLKIATVMTVTLSCDHRVVDGALGAQLLSAFKGYIEEPVTMLL
jgi:pyruvate dehydrogenase E2 component (dihydrolipoamide acetyltransferase)